MVTTVDVYVVLVDEYRSAARNTIAVAIHVSSAIGGVSTSTVATFDDTGALSSIGVPYPAPGASNQPRLGECKIDVDVLN
jgi:hypothetical protein